MVDKGAVVEATCLFPTSGTAASAGPAPSPSPDQVVSVLCVSPHAEDHRRLSGIFSQSNWQLHHANECGDAIDFIQSHPVPVVISERDLCAFGWKNILATLAQLPRWPQPRLIVASNLAEDRKSVV